LLIYNISFSVGLCSDEASFSRVLRKSVQDFWSDLVYCIKESLCWQIIKSFRSSQKINKVSIPWVAKLQCVLQWFIKLSFDTTYSWCQMFRLAYPYDFGVRLTIFGAILRPYDCCQFPYDSVNLQYFRKVFGTGPSFHCGSVYYRSYLHFRLLKKRCQNVKILIINPKSI
jgi:hypothetical protein